MKNYTESEVLYLLKKQREECLKKAVIKKYEYINPYSDSDGQIEYGIVGNSILDAEINLSLESD